MPRLPRLAPAGGIFHITSRGNRRQAIFLDDDDRLLFLRLFDAAVTRFRWTCHAYCLMDNHVHVLITTEDENLSEGMQWLLGRYAQDFNWRHGLDGHLFQGRFKSQLVTSNWHLLELSRYIVLNPVRAGMRAAAADWPWSSYRAAVGICKPPLYPEARLAARAVRPDRRGCAQDVRELRRRRRYPSGPLTAMAIPAMAGV